MPSRHSDLTPQQVDKLTEQAASLRHQDTRQALKLCLNAKEIALKIDYQKGLASSLYLVSLCHFILADSEDILDTIYQAQSLFKILGDEQGEATVHNLIANLYHRQNQYGDALDHYRYSLQLRRKTGDRIGEAGSLNNIGLVYCDLSRFADSIEYHLQSLEIAEQVQESNLKAYSLVNIARVFVEMGEHTRALEYYQRGLEFNQGSADQALDSTILTQLGQIQAQLGNHELSIEYLADGLKIARQIGNLHDEGLALIGLGISYQAFDEFTLAGQVLNDALEIMKKTNDQAREAEILRALGNNYARQHQHPDAISCLNEALALAGKIQAQQEVGKIHRVLSQVYEELKDFQQALNHYQRYDQIWQLFHSQATDRRIQSLLVDGEIKKAQREAEEQRLKSRELSVALDAIRKDDQQKTLLLHQLETQAKMLEQLAREDGLTGIANRRWLDLQLIQEFERARRFKRPLCVAMIDVDDFKMVNDLYSHLTGDKVMRTLARLLRDHSRSVDVLGRYGGEEFMLILVETSLNEGIVFCEQLRQHVERYSWGSVHSDLKRLTVSIGLGSNKGCKSLDQMVARADQQLYLAKHQGKNQVCAATV